MKIMPNNKKKAANLKLAVNLKRSVTKAEEKQTVAKEEIICKTEEKQKAKKEQIISKAEEEQNVSKKSKKKHKQMIILKVIPVYHGDENDTLTARKYKKKRCTKTEEDMDLIIIEKETAGEPVSTRSKTSGNIDKDKTLYLEGNRVVDLCHIGHALENGCKQCGERPLSLTNIVSERNLGFYSVFKIKCETCAALTFLHTQRK